MTWFSSLWNRILNCIFVRKCVGCGTLVDASQPWAVCRDCAAKLAQEGQTVRENRYMAQAVSAVPYAGATRDAMRRFKFQNQRYLGNTFAALLYQRVCEMPFMREVDLVTCVPMHPNRERYYNQAAVLAKSFARMARLPYAVVLEKQKNLPPLSQMGRHDRMQAVYGAFSTVEKADIAGKAIALIDDIYTSGATTGECARVLKSNGAKAVYVLTPCFAIDKNYHTTMTKAVNTTKENMLR